jgi:hypothetical protein
VASRDFNAPDGTLWTVVEVIPGAATGNTTRVAVHLPEELAGGWLTFECDQEKRRFYPIPDQWELLSIRQLWLLCEHADRVPPRKAPSTTAPWPERIRKAQDGVEG